MTNQTIELSTFGQILFVEFPTVEYVIDALGKKFDLAVERGGKFYVLPTRKENNMFMLTITPNHDNGVKYIVDSILELEEGEEHITVDTQNVVYD